MKSAVYSHSVNEITGQATNLGQYEGRVLLIVNVASKCGLTPQYEQLEKVYEKYHSRGFEVLGFPSNEFLGQEPGSNDEIKKFCEMKFGIKFPMFEKISVNGENRNSLYTDLIKAQPSAKQVPNTKLAENLAKHGQVPKAPSDILWNFEKFLVNKKGEVVARFAPDMTPDDPAVIAAIEAAL